MITLSEQTLELIAEYDRKFSNKRDKAKESRLDRISRLAQVICKKRDEAVQERRVSGIEDRWRDSEEKYAGIDDANRHLRGARSWFKGQTLDSPITSSNTREAGNSQPRSVVFPRLSARYVDSTFAKICEMALSPDDKSFSIEPTPVPDLMGLEKDETRLSAHGVVLQKPAPPQPQSGGLPPMPQNGQPPPEQAVPPLEDLTVKDLVEEQFAKAREGASRAERRIYDWLLESNYTTHLRKVIFDAIRIGVGVLKGPYPKDYRRTKVTREKEENGKHAIKVVEIKETRPSVCRVNPWNFFPAPGCGDDPKNGDYCVERVFATPKEVRAMAKETNYIVEMVDAALKEGPKRSSSKEQGKYYGGSSGDGQQYEVWYFYGTLTVEDFAMLNPEMAYDMYAADPEMMKPHEEMGVIVTLVHDRIVYATPHYLNSKTFPYHVIPYIFLEDSWAGESLPERLDVPERILTSATRAMMNNAGNSSGSQFIIDRAGITPANGNPIVEPDKIWYRNNHALAEDIRKLFLSVDIPNKTGELMPIVEYAFKLAEESSNLPLITQGFAGKNSPETLGATQLQNSNAAQMLREIAHNLDDGIMKPCIQLHYEWLLLDPEVPEDEKVDCYIHAKGSQALVERALQDQFIWQVASLVSTNPMLFDADPKKLFVEMLKSRGLDPRSYKFSEEEKQKMEQNQQPPPQVMAAQIRAQAELQKEQMRLAQELQLEQAQIASAQQIAQLDMQIEMEKLRLEDFAQREEAQRKLQDLEIKRQIFVGRYANERALNLENAKKELATTAMKIRTQRELALLKAGGEALAPPTEPPGKARPGESFTA